MGTLRELYGNAFVNSRNAFGTLWELHGDTLGTLWEQGVMYSIFYFYKILNFSLCCIIHCINTIPYRIYLVLYHIHILYIVLYHTHALYNTHILYIAMRSELYEPTLYFYTLHPPLPWQWLWDNHFLGGNNVENIEAMLLLASKMYSKHQHCLWTLLFPSNVFKWINVTF
jgi:hypothetical protein